MMIIECGRCGTRYRFDESGIDRDGVWVRCSRCRLVFFQVLTPSQGVALGGEGQTEPEEARPPVGVPLRDSRQPAVMVQGRAVPPRGDTMVVMPRSRSEDSGSAAVGPTDEQSSTGGIFYAGADEFRQASQKGAVTEPAADIMPEAAWGTQVAQQSDADTGEEEAPAQATPRRRGWRAAVGITLAAVAVIIVCLGVYFWLYPDARQAAVQTVATLPGMDNLFGKQTSGQDAITAVALRDLRQRYVSNWLLGNVRVIEGVAVNQAKCAITRVRVRAQLQDATGAVLAERISVCGNNLTDQELATMTEEEIQRALTNLQGSDISNDRIEAGGRIPFMIVIPHEPPQPTRTMLATIAAERLLP